MHAEAPPTGTSTLSTRAAIAQLTLRLRASLHEAEAAEGAEAGIDEAAALAKLRARIEPIMDARLRSLDESLAHAEAEAAAAVAAARLEASAIVARGSSPVDVMAWTKIEDDTHPVVQVLPPVNIVIDAEAFARVIASVLGEHLAVGRIGLPAIPVVPQPSLKHARHLDVVLVGIATLIVLVILAAWIG